jgi:hypothetical protein
VNYRWYYQIRFPSPSGWITEAKNVVQFADSTTVNQKEYYKWSGASLLFDRYVRVENGKIFALNSDQTESVWFDFAATSGTTYMFAPPNERTWSVKAYRGACNSNPVLSCFDFSFKPVPYSTDSDLYYGFQENLGLAQMSSWANGDHYLAKAVLEETYTFLATETPNPIPIFGELTASPNPFSATTLLQFSLQQSQQVEVQLFDLLGRKVKTIYEGVLFSGVHSFDIEGRYLANGVYIVQLKTPEKAMNYKIIKQ